MAWKNFPGYRRVSGGSGKKYGNRKITDGGDVFDSKKEHKRWQELQLLEKSGEISGLQRQVKYVLIPAQYEFTGEFYKRGPNKGKPKPGKLIEREVAYIADFVYMDKNGTIVVEDCKGMRTKEYILKRKMMLAVHGIRIKET